MVNSDLFHSVLEEFENQQEGFDFYYLSKKTVEKGNYIAGFLLFIATWNSNYFRFHKNSFNLDEFSNIIGDLNANFEILEKESILSIDLGDHRVTISDIFTRLSHLKWIGATGAAKIMHLKNPNLFIIWDSYIRGERKKSSFKSLEIFIIGILEATIYSADSRGYISFLSSIQNNFNGVGWNDSSKAFTKAIDEFNFMSITKKLQSLK